MSADEAEPGGQSGAQHEGGQHKCYHRRGLQDPRGRRGRLGSHGSAGDALGWPCEEYNAETGLMPQMSSPSPFPTPESPAEDYCVLTGGQPRHRDHDGLRQRVQVRAVGTQTLIAATAGARARLIPRQTLGGGGGKRRGRQGPGSRGGSPGLPRDLSVQHYIATRCRNTRPLEIRPLRTPLRPTSA